MFQWNRCAPQDSSHKRTKPSLPGVQLAIFWLGLSLLLAIEFIAMFAGNIIKDGGAYLHCGIIHLKSTARKYQLEGIEIVS